MGWSWASALCFVLLSLLLAAYRHGYPSKLITKVGTEDGQIGLGFLKSM